MSAPSARLDFGVRQNQPKAREKGERNMQIIVCDYFPGFQQIALVDTETGECGERRPEHTEEAGWTSTAAVYS